jgi:hypothetical protein
MTSQLCVAALPLQINSKKLVLSYHAVYVGEPSSTNHTRENGRCFCQGTNMHVFLISIHLVLYTQDIHWSTRIFRFLNRNGRLQQLFETYRWDSY